MIELDTPEIWFVTGSQHLYGEAALREVEANSRTLVEGLNQSGKLPLKLVLQQVMTTPDQIRKLALEANGSPRCAGLVLWMHTFSPAKMWIGGLTTLIKPFLHLHTQFHARLPWSEIDMDFMNLHQAAHGDREAGFLHTRLRLPRKVVAGHWKDPLVQDRLAGWMRVARAWQDWQGARVARLGDNMRNVAVTEGNKVSAEATFGFAVNGYGIGDLVEHLHSVSDGDVSKLCAQYEEEYAVEEKLRKNGDQHDTLREGARIELALRSFLADGRFKGFTTTFEDLHGLKQLPGLAVQRLMADGYGFGAEGDWKTAALLRLMKVMGEGLPGGTSFMEDYTYDMGPDGTRVLGSHMLEICPTISREKPRLEAHPLGIGGKADPVRLVFEARSGPALNASLIDLGNRFRLIVNEVDAMESPEPLPNLPVARALWQCKPDFATAVESWILAGGAHHTGFSYDVKTSHLEDFASIAGIEIAIIDDKTDLRSFLAELRSNEVYYHLKTGAL